GRVVWGARGDLVVQPGGWDSLRVRLRPAGHAAGTVFALDRKTPAASVVVQLVDPAGAGQTGSAKVIAATVTDSQGAFRFVNLKPGRFQVRCQTPGDWVFGGRGQVYEFDGNTPV